MRRSQAGRNQVSQFGQYHGYSEAIYDGYQRRSQHLALEDRTRLAYDLLLPTKDGAPADEPLPTLFKYTPYLRVFTIYDADGNLLLDDLYELKWYERAALRLLTDANHVSFVELPMVSASTDDHDDQKDEVDMGDAR